MNMGLLNTLPDELLDLIRSTQRPTSTDPNGFRGPTIDALETQAQRPPFSLAGPDLRPRASLEGPPSFAANIPTATGLGFSNALSVRRPMPNTQNLTAQMLQLKGVPEADIAASSSNPAFMKQLITQLFSPATPGDSSSIGPALPETSTHQIGLKCDGWQGCSRGGSFGHGGMYSVGGQTLCRDCAVKKTGSETLSGTEQTDLLRPYLIGGGK